MLYATTRVAVAAVESNPSLSKPVHLGDKSLQHDAVTNVAETILP